MSEFQNENQNQRVSSPVAPVQVDNTGVSLAAPAYQIQSQQQTNPVLGNADNRRLAVEYNLIAQGFAYSTTLGGTQSTLAQAMGFQPQWHRTTEDNGAAENSKTGFFAGLLLPQSATPSEDDFSLEGEVSSEQTNDAVLAFRGSESSNMDEFVLDWINNDMDPIAVGFTAFMANYDTIHGMLVEAVEQTGQRVAVTGHSLGGSLAKQAALHFPHLISNCYTYQAPGISAEQQAYLEEHLHDQGNIYGDQMSEEDRALLLSKGLDDVDSHGFDDIVFEAHMAEGDIVNYAGGGRVPGANSRRILHDPSGFTGLQPGGAHTANLTSSSEYADIHADLHSEMSALDPAYSGTTDELYSSSRGSRTGVEAMDIDNPARNTENNYHIGIEAARDAVIAEMFNPHSRFINDFPQRIPDMPLGGRIQILQSLLNGPGVIESLTKGAGVGMGIAALIAAPGTVLGMLAGGFTAFSEYGSDSPGATAAVTAGGAIAGGAVGGQFDRLLDLIPVLGQGRYIAAPIAGVIGGLAYSYFALSNDINETQEAALKMLLYSPDQKDLVQGIGGATLFYSKMDTIVNDFFGSDVFERTRSELTKGGGYFAQLDANQAAEEIENNLEGGFLGFGDNTQEKIISDVLVHGVVGNEALTILGDGDYDEGLEIVLKKLQGREDRAVSNMYDFTDGRWRWFW